MGQKQKLISRLKAEPKDFTFNELERLLELLGYERMSAGKSAGSRVKYHCRESGHVILLHKPHPSNVLKAYVIKYLLDELGKEGKI